jgi:hypothetical protein
MIIDITSIIIIYFYINNSNKQLDNNDSLKKIINSYKKDGKKSSKKNSKKSSKKDRKKDKSENSNKNNENIEKEDKNIINENNINQTFIKNESDKEMISLYNQNKDESIITYK